MIIKDCSRSSGGSEVWLESEDGEKLCITLADAKRLGLDDRDALPVQIEDEEMLFFLAEKLKAIRYCKYLLGFSDKSEKTLSMKLKEKQYPKDVIDEALRVMREGGVVDDYSLCERKLKALAKTKLYGPYRIKSELLSKGFSQECLNQAFENADIDFDGIALELLQKLLRSLKADAPDRSQLEKIRAKMARYGHSGDAVRRALKYVKQNEAY